MPSFPYNDSDSTIPNFRAIDINTLALHIIQGSTHSAGDATVVISLSSFLFGELLGLYLVPEFPFSQQRRSVDGSISHGGVLSHVSKGLFISFPEPPLMPEGSQQGSFARTNTKVLILSTVVLYTSTGTYIAALVWNRSQANHLVLGATSGLSSVSYDGHQEMAAFEDTVRKQSWMAVIALVLNVRATTVSSIRALLSCHRHSALLGTPSCGGGYASFGGTRSCIASERCSWL